MGGRRSFTLAEMMVAVAVLVVVILATSRIFGTASKVTGLGQAAADVLQEAAAIERQMRGDFQRLSPEGFMVIRCVAVPNQLNVGGALINPALPPGAWVRADQILFFTNGVQSVQTYRQGQDLRHKSQSIVSRVYWGHAFQLPAAGPVREPFAQSGDVVAHDPAFDPMNPLVPWSRAPGDTTQTVRTLFPQAAGNDYSIVDSMAGVVDATQPEARRWLLVRQPVLLADDGGAGAVYLDQARTAYTIGDLVVRHGRVDGAAQQLDDVRNAVMLDAAGSLRPWASFAGGDQRSVILSALFYPRAERVAPGMHRVDQALTSHVIAQACSSFVVDWTYRDGLGDAVGPDGTFHPGVQVDLSAEQPWFGMNPAGDPQVDRGVGALGQWVNLPNVSPPQTIFPANIDGAPTQLPNGIRVYEAVFGYNRTRPLVEDPASPQYGQPVAALGYTPFPSAIRVTMTLHDDETRLETGRQVQFVFDLPERVN